MKKPTESYEISFKENGNKKTLHLFSYAALLCRKDDQEVKAVRLDYFETRSDARKKVEKEWPGWKVKGIWRLHDEDFD